MPDVNLVEAPGVEPGSENTPLQASTCVSLLYCLSCRGSTRARNHPHYPTLVSPSGRQARPASYPTRRRPYRPRGSGPAGRQCALFRRLLRKHSRLRLYLFYRFYEVGRDLGMQPELTYPRRIRFAPLCWSVLWLSVPGSCRAPYRFRRIARCTSRSASFCLSVARLS